MKARSLTALLVLLAGMLFLEAQSNSATPPAKSDNPLAALNLSDPGSPPGPTGFVAKVTRHLIVLENGQAKALDAASLQGVKYWAFYYSDSGRAACLAFTPKLVVFYKKFKPLHPNFELIYVNHDENEDAMLAYMKTVGMPWPAVRFDNIQDDDANKYCGQGFPDLVLVDENGKVLTDSFSSYGDRDPDRVLDEILHLVH